MDVERHEENIILKTNEWMKPMNETGAHRFAESDKEEISKARKDGRDVSKNHPTLPRGRPLLLECVVQMVQRFLLALHLKGGLVSSAIAISQAKHWLLKACNMTWFKSVWILLPRLKIFLEE